MRPFTPPNRATHIWPRAIALAALCGLITSCADDRLPPLPPGALEVVSDNPGVSRERLARAVDALFTRDGIGETRALVVLLRGAVAAERYGEGYSAEMPLVGWSMSKTVTGVLIGMMVADGKLALDDPAPVAAWQRAGDPRGEITLRHLLQMRSGLRHDEKAEPIYTSPEVRMLFLDGHDDAGGWAEAQPPEQPAGSRFNYSTATSVILADIATDLIAPPSGSAGARQQAMAHFLDSRIAKPLGMASLRGEYDASGTLLGGSFVWANARDWGRFGEFLRHGGSVRGAQLVPRGWIDFMKSESPRSPDYGAHLWLNRPSGGERDVLFANDGPGDAFAAVGHLGQYVIVVPSRGLTVVRLGKTDQEERAALVDALAEVVALYPPL